MYTEYLREFAALARRLNYTQAAADLHISQPTLSRHISDLERHFGCQLLTRGERPELTYPGETLLNETNALLRCEDQLERAMAAARDVKLVHLRIEDWRYSHETMALLRETIARVTDGASECRVEFLPIPYGVEVVEAVREGLLDIGILAHTAQGDIHFDEGEGIGVLPIEATRSPLYFFVDAANPLAERDCLSIDDLDGHPITVPLNPECVNIAGDLTRVCHARGFEPVFHSTRLASIDDLFCMDLKDGILIGLEEYLSRGFATAEHVRMIPCSDDVCVTMYLLYRENDDNPILHALLRELS